MSKTVIGGMCLNTEGIELVKVEGPFEWMKDHEQYLKWDLTGIDYVEWYVQKNENPDPHPDGYIRVFQKDAPSPYKEDEYDYIYLEVVDDK